ncbi:hypothetical protein [Paenibacillus sp. Soil750]|uniref:hypothetical protein n=1 Tax=Paenibacillus sp. Soil750 TaxID=1736398 RepID=UPI0006F60BEE|nr:hypothetical protein [Paenibacillus sp. Soil750]KRE56575.1 hypothetical protein ASL11_32920 [Paenibacillus sp. Soil750]
MADKVLLKEAWTKQPFGIIGYEILNEDQIFVEYAYKYGFRVAVRDLKIDRSEWDRLIKLMRSR